MLVGPPLVLFNQLIEGLDRDFVGMDSLMAGRMLTSYLLRLGHSRIAFIGGRAGLWSADMRLRGFRELMRQAEMAVNPAWCVVANYRGEPAYDQCVSILSGSERPTAILAAINDLGFRCHADISLVSIDDVPWSGVIKPRLTVVAQPIEEISRTAVDWLLERIAGGADATLSRRQMILPPRLIVGESCADLRDP